ncbi:hypothetical protein BpHYR1_037656 [Brachionus plicatilis]|uniref:Uncharacterized protein n=1 Tax=Brachionus plicatilis TaxID=10195 RepID=A0A3M7RPY9_BRAPC|nr:hypothetical protein BpHYR1_037656 [Brachionus plicatilis]
MITIQLRFSTKKYVLIYQNSLNLKLWDTKSADEKKEITSTFFLKLNLLIILLLLLKISLSIVHHLLEYLDLPRRKFDHTLGLLNKVLRKRLLLYISFFIEAHRTWRHRAHRLNAG